MNRSKNTADRVESDIISCERVTTVPKNDNVKSVRLYESVKAVAGAEAADKTAQTLYLSSSADYKRKWKWANDVCAYLEENFDSETVKKMRMGCSCTPPPKLMDEGRKLYRESAAPDEFCEKFGAGAEGAFRIWHEDGAFYFSYPTCYCSCIKRADGIISKTWCLCTLGYTKALFDYILERETDVELLESIKTGGEKCSMRITYRDQAF